VSELPPAAPRAPPPPGWRWKRRRKPRKPRSFHDDFPTLALKARFVGGTLLALLAAAAMFVLPAAVSMLQQVGWMAGSIDFVVLEMLGLGLAVLLIYAAYTVDPFGQRR
jgi:hypothetical protein